MCKGTEATETLWSIDIASVGDSGRGEAGRHEGVSSRSLERRVKTWVFMMEPWEPGKGFEYGSGVIRRGKLVTLWYPEL